MVLAFTLASVAGCGGLNSELGPTGLTGSAVPVALNQFSLNGSFRNTGLGGNGIMTGLGGGTLGASGYNFVHGGGLRLVGLTGVADTYTIAMTLAVNQAERADWLYTKTLDFPASSLTRGAGVFVSDKASIETYSEDETSGNFERGMEAVASRTMITLVVTRDQAGTVTSYVNGVPANAPRRRRSE